MSHKEYKVYFANTKYGRDSRNTIARPLVGLYEKFGANLPPVELEGDDYQIRDLKLVGNVWTGSFARLREDAPHIVDRNSVERAIDLDAGDRVVDKCHFIYRALSDVLIWQANRSVAGLGRLREYLSRVFPEFVSVNQVMNEAHLERVLQGQIYELSFGFARPDGLVEDSPSWNRAAMNLMSHVDAAQAKFMLRAPRKGSLAASAKNMVRTLLRTGGAEKVRVRMTDESDPIELFMAPLKDSIQVDLTGNYPSPEEVLRALEEAYDRQKKLIPSASL